MESIKTSITASATQQDRETEDRVFRTCARAGVCWIGIQSGFGVTADMVLFQKPSTPLAIPLATFTNPDEAIAAIKAKVAQVQR